MGKSKRHHIVPRSYLGGFVVPNTAQGKEPFVLVYNRAKVEPFARAPKKVAVRSHYYSFVTPEGEREDAVEEYLSRHESLALPVLRKLDAGTEPKELTAEERSSLSHFIALLELRVPRFRDQVESFVADIGRRIAILAAQHPEYLAETMRKVAAEKGETTPTDIDNLREFILRGEYTVKTNPQFSLQAMVKLAPEIAKYPYNLRWRVLVAPASTSFCTSDGPVVRITTLQPYPKWMGVGWESPWMEATLPLSSRSCLLISMHHPEGREDVSLSQVIEVNRRTIAYAQNEVYAGRSLTPEELIRPPNLPWQMATNAVLEPNRAEGDTGK